jgi:glycosyltransferase involved in cell wall biosynthesis
MKIAVIRNEESSNWKSCQAITPNILHAYKKIPGIKITEIFISRHSNTDSLEKACLEIKKLAPDFVSFIDHFPFPTHLLTHYIKFHSAGKNPRFVLHLFGCVTYWLYTWRFFEDFFRKNPPLMFVASEAQKNFLKRVLQNPDDLHICPFPLSRTVFHPSEKLRTLGAKRFSVDTDEINLIYTGRVVIQKNVFDLLHIFRKFKDKNPSAHLHIAGEFDDQGAPFFGIKNELGQMFASFNEELRKLNLENSVRFHGNLSQPELNTLLNACDAFLSLSTYNDEDYGYAPLEALFAGLPAVLTAWGGYKSYGFDKYSRLVPVHGQGKQLTFSYDNVLQELDGVLKFKKDFSSRIAVSDYFNERFSIDVVGDLLAKELRGSRRSFSGFNSNLEKFAATYQRFPTFIDNGEVAFESYLEHYEPYYAR